MTPEGDGLFAVAAAGGACGNVSRGVEGSRDPAGSRGPEGSREVGGSGGGIADFEPPGRDFGAGGGRGGECKLTGAAAASVSSDSSSSTARYPVMSSVVLGAVVGLGGGFGTLPHGPSLAADFPGEVT